MALQVKDYTAAGKSKSGINYTFILRVSQNSIDKASNSSNVTVQALLTGDYDGLIFYNQSCSISCSLNDQQIIYEGAWRTYEGTEEALFESWTGDLAHNDDGSLSLNISGKWWSGSTANFMPPTMNVEGVMELTAIVQNTPPHTPEGLTAASPVAAGGAVEIFWNAAADEEGNVTGYQLERSTDGGESFESVYTGDSTEFCDAAPQEAGAQLLYRVCAQDAEGETSPWTEPVAVNVNALPYLNEGAAFGVYTDEECSLPTEAFSLGQTLHLMVGSWSDPDGNLDGGQLLIQYRTKTPAGELGTWADLLTAEAAADTDYTFQTAPETAEYLGSIQFRATVTDAMGAACAQWLESAWILRKDVPLSRVQFMWRKPTIDGGTVMPYVWIAGRWVRHGGEYQKQDPTLAILGTGVLGVMILGKEK